MRTTTMVFTAREIKDILKAWFLLSIAFAVLLSQNVSLTAAFATVFLIALVTAGLGFVLHELAHKMVAHRFGCQTEFRANNGMLFFAVLMSFVGFIFAAPGAVRIAGAISKKQFGLISLAGPGANIVLAILFAGASFWLPVLSYGFFINAWLALFNLLPFFGMDGVKILAWNKVVYGVALTLAAVLSILAYL